MTPEDEKKLFELEQQLDIPYKDRYYNKDDKRNYEAEQQVKNCNIPCVSIALENKRKVGTTKSTSTKYAKSCKINVKICKLINKHLYLPR